MFALRFFANRLFPNRFFPHIGANPAPSTTGVLVFDPNNTPIQFVDEFLPIQSTGNNLDVQYNETDVPIQNVSQLLPILFAQDKR